MKITIDVDPVDMDRIEEITSIPLPDRSRQEEHELNLLRAGVAGRCQVGYFVENFKGGN